MFSGWGRSITWCWYSLEELNNFTLKRWKFYEDVFLWNPFPREYVFLISEPYMSHIYLRAIYEPYISQIILCWCFWYMKIYGIAKSKYFVVHVVTTPNFGMLRLTIIFNWRGLPLMLTFYFLWSELHYERNWYRNFSPFLLVHVLVITNTYETEIRHRFRFHLSSRVNQMHGISCAFIYWFAWCKHYPWKGKMTPIVKTTAMTVSSSRVSCLFLSIYLYAVWYGHLLC